MLRGLLQLDLRDMLAGDDHKTNKSTCHIHFNILGCCAYRGVLILCVSGSISNCRWAREAIFVRACEDNISRLDTFRSQQSSWSSYSLLLFPFFFSRRIDNQIMVCTGSLTESVHLKAPTKMRVSVAWTRNVWPIKDSKYWTAWVSSMVPRFDQPVRK